MLHLGTEFALDTLINLSRDFTMLFFVLSLMLSIGCGPSEGKEEDSGLDCTNDIQFSLTIRTFDSDGNPVQPDSLVYTIDGGGEVEAECANTDCTEWTAGYDEAGAYALTAVLGAEELTEEITIEMGECHVEFQTVDLAFSKAEIESVCDVVEDGFESELEHHVGCGDVYLSASNEANDTMLTFSTIDLDLVADALEANGSITTNFDLGGEDARLIIQTGVGVRDFACNDDMSSESRIDYSFSAISGTAVVTVAPEEEPNDYTFGIASVVITDAVFSDGESCDLTIENFEWVEELVGWYAG